MNLIAKILLKIFVLCNLFLLTTSSNIDLPQVELDVWAHSDEFVSTENLSELVDDVEYDNNNISLHNSQNLTFTNVYSNSPTSSENQFVDLDYDSQNQSIENQFVDLGHESQNQSIENISTIPEHLPRKHKLSSEITTDNIEYQPPEKRRKVSDNNHSSSPKENTFGCEGTFSHESANLFVVGGKLFKLIEYKVIFKFYKSFFIEEFCDKDQVKSLQSIGISWSERRDEEKFEKLEANLKRMIHENVEVKKVVGQTSSYVYQNVKRILDPKRTKGLFYLLVYSFYETGMIGLPRSSSAVKKILVNIITHTRLMAYINNDSVKKALQLKKVKISKKTYSTMPKFDRETFFTGNFRYKDFTMVLTGGSFPKKDMFLTNADKMKKEISDNIQLIIDQEFSDNTEYKRLCEEYNSKVVEFNKNILFERFPFRIGKYAADNCTLEDIDYDVIIYGNGYPKNILSCLMDTDTKNQIVNFPDIRIKSVFILIFISKICLCNVTDLCTLPEYLILIESLQKAYLKYKEKTIASDDFQSLLSYFFSLDYLDEDYRNSLDYREKARGIISTVFPEYNVIFPKFDSEIDNLQNNS